MLLIETVLR